jgi:hypothetical protein
VNDKTWDITIRVQVTTLSGWEPDRSDVEEWLEVGGTLELVAIESVKEQVK